MDSVLMENKELKLNKSNWKLTKVGDLANDISKRVDNPSESGYDRFVGLNHFISGDIKSMLLYPKGDLDKENVVGTYYTDVDNEKDPENLCEIGYLDVIKEGKLSEDWVENFINKRISNGKF